jgi:hypothetical protein
VKRDRDLPALDIDLEPARPAMGTRDRHAPQQKPRPARGSRRRRLTIGVAALVAVTVLIGVSTLDGRSKPEAAPMVPDAVPAATTAPPTIRTATPGVLGETNTNLLLWTFDSDSRLQVLDLDSGQLRTLGPGGGSALYPLWRQVVIADFGSARVVSVTGETLSEILGFGLPVVVHDTQLLWTLSDPFPRRWQQHFVDGTLTRDIPVDSNTSLFPYSDRAVLLVSPTGTSLFDLVTRQQRPITPTQVVAAEGPTLIGRACTAERCTLTAIDADTGRERVLVSDLSINDAVNATLSPDGRYLAITRKAVESGRHALVIDVATAATLLQTSAGISFGGGGPAWSWSPDSSWLFITMSAQQVIAVNARGGVFTQIDIALPLTPLHGIAVTRR